MKQNTWTLTAIARNSWDIPRTLEVVQGVKTSEKAATAASLYQKYPECFQVNIRKEDR